MVLSTGKRIGDENIGACRKHKWPIRFISEKAQEAKIYIDVFIIKGGLNKYLVVRKSIQTLLLTFVVATIIFVIYKLIPAPGSLAAQSILIGGKWNLVNYLIYLRNMYTFNFGHDAANSFTVLEELRFALPYSFLLFGVSEILSFMIGIPLGIVTTWVRRTKKEYLLLVSSNAVNAIPFFVLAIWFVLYFTFLKPIFPTSDTIMQLSWIWTDPLKAAYFLFLPMATLVIIETAGHVLTTRAAMIGVLGEDYITTARAKGVPERSVMFHHVARNAMIPVTARMALEFAILINGAVIVEIIFSYPGIGHLLYNATLHFDYALAEGALFVLSLVTIITYAAVDFIHMWLDPRIKL